MLKNRAPRTWSTRLLSDRAGAVYKRAPAGDRRCERGEPPSATLLSRELSFLCSANALQDAEREAGTLPRGPAEDVGGLEDVELEDHAKRLAARDAVPTESYRPKHEEHEEEEEEE